MHGQHPWRLPLVALLVLFSTLLGARSVGGMQSGNLGPSAAPAPLHGSAAPGGRGIEDLGFYLRRTPLRPAVGGVPFASVRDAKLPEDKGVVEGELLQPVVAARGAAVPAGHVDLEDERILVSLE